VLQTKQIHFHLRDDSVSECENKILIVCLRRSLIDKTITNNRTIMTATTSGQTHERTLSILSTETGNRWTEEPIENPGEATNDDVEGNSPHTDPPQVPRPPGPPESRDTSVCSRNTRDSLRRAVLTRGTSFTPPERMFLEQLTLEGSDRDVQRALQTVADLDLFFEQAPEDNAEICSREPNIGLDISNESEGPDDATRDGEAASVATQERMGLLKGSSNHKSNRLGSMKRLEVLQRRRSDASLSMATLWRAHATGLAVTPIGSRRSLIRRDLSIGSNMSNMSNLSGLSVLFGNRPHPGASQDDIFRSEDASKNGIMKTSTPGSKGKPPRKLTQLRKLPPMPMGRPIRSGHRRSKSATLFSPQRNLPKISEKASGKPAHTRAKSFVGKRLSVTFHHIDEELEFDKDLSTKAVTPVNAVSQPTMRHASSDSIIGKWQEAPKSQTIQRDTSNSSIPSLHQGTPIRQESISSIQSLHAASVAGQSTGSIPSLHHGTPLMDLASLAGQSTTSIPSLHHGHALKDTASIAGQSTTSIPSLHHGHALSDASLSTMQRNDSVSTFASLDEANPVRQESVASFSSLHHGNPIRQESASTLPSLHPARPIRQNSGVGNIPPNALTQDEIVHHFGVTDQMASAWIDLAASSACPSVASEDCFSFEGAEKRSSCVSALTQPTLPSDLRISNVSTASTAATAAVDALKITAAATEPTVATTVDGGDDVSLLTPTSTRAAFVLDSRQKPVFFRQASRNAYEGEGFEVEELDDRPLDGTLSDTDSYFYSYQQDTGVFRTVSLFPNNINNGTIRTAGSFDDASLFSSFGQQQRTSEVFREIRRSLSDDSLANFVGGRKKEFFLQIPNSTEGPTDADTFVDELSDEECESNNWDMEFASPANGRFDAWNILQDEYANGYGGAGTLGFKIMGTSINDVSAHPHVLSPPLMESLQAFLPTTKSGENFFLKYSMIRDGASLQTLLMRARGIQHSILAVETIDGEVFGSFTGQAWRKSWNYFGTGESFLWRMRHSRLETTNGILDQAQKESEIDVFPYTGENEFIQLCTHDRIAVGGGMPEEEEKKSQNEPARNPLVDHEHDWGLGLALRADLLEGSSSPCLTFGSPSLCKAKPSGERFEVVNVELWTTTPCSTQEDAEKLELGKLFLS